MTLEEILQRIGSYVDQDASTPSDSDLAIRQNFVNFAYEEWAVAYDWEELKEDYNFTISNASQVSLSLPTNFMKFQQPIVLHNSGVNYEYKQIDGRDLPKYNETDYVYYVEGNRQAGYTAIVPMGFASGASVTTRIQVFPSSLATLTHIPAMNNPNYLVQRGIAFVLEGRGDSRFPVAKADADRILANMIEHQNSLKSGTGMKIRNSYSLQGFRIGRR